MQHTEHKFSLLPGKLRKGHHHVGRITGIEVQREMVYYLSVFDKLRHGDKVVRKLLVLPPRCLPSEGLAPASGTRSLWRDLRHSVCDSFARLVVVVTKVC